MSIQTANDFGCLVCPLDGKILGDYCKTTSGKYECPRCRKRYSITEVML